MANLARALVLLFCAAAGLAAAGPLTVTDAWIRATPPGARTAAAYLTITNSGAVDRLLEGSTPAAGGLELHTQIAERGMQRMTPLTQLELPAGAAVRLTPGGLHLMLVDLAAPLAAGTSVTLSLRFATAGQLQIEVPVVDARTSSTTDHSAH